MKKALKRILKITLLTAVAAITTLVVIILFPQRVFAMKIEYKNFKVYSNKKIGNDIKIVLDNTMQLIQKSELYDSSYKYNIILCHNSFYNKIDNTLLRSGAAATVRFNNVIVKVRIDPKNDLAFPTFRKACEINLTYLIAHEMIHCLQANKYGIKKFNPFRHPEFWKLEGYPEYIARKPELTNFDYSLINEIEHYMDLENKASDIWILEKSGCETRIIITGAD